MSMKLAQQVCTPQQGMRLKQLGVAQDASIFSHFADSTIWFTINIKHLIDAESDKLKCAAFTVAELGVMLNTSNDGVLPDNHNNEVVNKWFEDNIEEYRLESTLRAALLIYLLENNLITSDEVNTRLTA